MKRVDTDAAERVDKWIRYMISLRAAIAAGHATTHYKASPTR